MASASLFARNRLAFTFARGLQPAARRLIPSVSRSPVRIFGTAVGFQMASQTAEPGGKSWDGAGMSQDDFMLKDECIVVDDNDNVVGNNNKYNCHKFLKEQPTGILHRAFSVFLFNEKGELLLQQRASDKITFPS
eukprot:3809178-Pyramimonas_sp.AAC.1